MYAMSRAPANSAVTASGPALKIVGVTVRSSLAELVLEVPLLGANQRRCVGEVGEIAQTEGGDVLRCRR